MCFEGHPLTVGSEMMMIRGYTDTCMIHVTVLKQFIDTPVIQSKRAHRNLRLSIMSSVDRSSR